MRKRKRLTWFLVFLLLVPSWSFSVHAEGGAVESSETIVYVDDDFEDGVLDEAPLGYEVEPIPQTEINKVIVSEVPEDSIGNSSEKAMKLHDEGGTNVKFTKAFKPEKDSLVVEFDFMQPRMAGTSKVLVLQDETGKKTPISIEFRKPGGTGDYSFTYSEGGEYIKLADAPADHEWMHLMVVADITNSVYDFYVNQQLMAEGVTFSEEVKEGIGRLHSVTPGSGAGSYFIDNLKIFHEPIVSPKGVEVLEGDEQVTLKWLSSQSADSYNVKRSTNSGGPYETIAENVKDPSFIDHSVQNGTTYYYIITSNHSNKESGPSKEVKVTPSGEPDFSQVVHDDFEDGEVGEAPKGYIVGPDPQTEINKVIVTNVPEDSKGNDSAKAMKLHDEGGTNVTFSKSFTPQKGAVVIEADFMQPSMAGTSKFLQIQNEAGNKTAISLELRKPTGEDDYTFTYSNNGAYVKLAETPNNDQWYSFKVIANTVTSKADIFIDGELLAEQIDFNSSLAEEGIGRISSATPGSGSGSIYFDNVQVYQEPLEAPEELYAISGNQKAQLYWKETPGAFTYNVKQSETSGGPYTAVAKEISGTTFIVNELKNGKTYYYIVSANGEIGESQYSKEIAVTPTEKPQVPQSPANVKASARSTQVEISWDEVEDANAYVVKRGQHEEGPFEVVADDFHDLAYRDSGLTNGITYHYVVTAKHVGGESKPSESVAVTPQQTIATPEKIQIKGEDQKISLSWDPVEGEASYTIQRADHLDAEYQTIAENVTEPVFYDEDVINGKSYYYTILAKNDHTSSLKSKPVVVRPISQNKTLAVPSGVKLSHPSEKEMQISWKPVDGADFYTVKRRASTTEPFTTIATEVTEPLFVDQAVELNKEYSYIVFAENDAEISYSSEQVMGVAANILTVAEDGSGDFTTVQDAVDVIPNGNTERTIIQIKSGVYREKVKISRDKTMISLIGLGDKPEDTLLIYDDNAKTIGEDGKELGTSNSYSVLVEANDFYAENLTIENASGNDTAQAVALSARGDRQMYKNVRIIGWQDTLFSDDDVRQYYVDSYISGDVDFIFGDATAVFENCIIHSRDGGYVTAASTPEGRLGYVFINSKITADEGLENKVDLGRPWRPYSNVIFINSWMDDHIRPAGWNNWGNTANEKTAHYAEYQSSGPGGEATNRFAWIKQLTLDEAAEYTAENILAGTDSWNPVENKVLLDSNVSLKSILLDGQPVESSGQKDYEISVPKDAIPVVKAEAEDDSSIVKVTQANDTTGKAMIEVTAEDGSHAVYTITFKEELAGPENLAGESGDSFIRLTWSKIEDAISYIVKRRTANSEAYKVIGNVTEPEFLDEDVTPGTMYFYVVTAVYDKGESLPSEEMKIAFAEEVQEEGKEEGKEDGKEDPKEEGDRTETDIGQENGMDADVGPGEKGEGTKPSKNDESQNDRDDKVDSSKVNQGSDPLVEESGGISDPEKKAQGGYLPHTATSLYNILLMGILLSLCGGLLYRRKNKKSLS